ncbi:hypothetical protein [Lacticaseibacillus kribbianus]|uniref:hypothetical protein n=1 Tax=Lacticaseibacillus kribbianus TaxID=2926292 RepID=UPI001CD66992|nr:hypothetical protein [Lacticaseibacillus kribbianus]
MMTNEPEKATTGKDDNPFCHHGMTCAPGCGCAGEDGKCQCAMASARRCTCNGLCGMRMASTK